MKGDIKKHYLYKYNQYVFNKKYIPYQVLGIDSGHVKDLMFVSKDGIFFYNFERIDLIRF